MELEDRLGHVFPQNWNVSERMAVQFCELTSRMVADLLSQRSAELDVKLLLYAIQRTTVFEEQLSKRYTGVTINGTSDDNRESTNPFEEQGSDYNSEGNPDGSNSQSELSETKLDKKLEQKKNNPFNKDRFDLFSRNLFDHNLWPIRFQNMYQLISNAFSPFLSIYVKSQERNLSELILRFHSDFENEINQTCEVSFKYNDH